MKMTYEQRQALCLIIKYTTEKGLRSFDKFASEYKRKVLNENNRYAAELERLNERRN